MSVGIGQYLELRQGQQLVMTPQLQQAIKLLQMSGIELSEFIATEIEKNPLLEADKPEDLTEDRNELCQEYEKKDSLQEETSQGVDQKFDKEEATEVREAFDSDIDNIFPDSELKDFSFSGSNPSSTRSGSTGGGVSGGEDFDVTANIPSETTLREYLLKQLSCINVSFDIRLIASDIVDQIDENGYFLNDLDEMEERLGASKAAVLQALSIVQSFEPTGIGARNLRECLMLQFIELGELTPEMIILLDNLNALAANDVNHLIKACGVDFKTLQEMVARIRSLSPKPAFGFSHEVLQVVIPDVYVHSGTCDEWVIELNTDTFPQILVNKNYMAKIEKNSSKDVHSYISEQQQSAGWLIRNIEQRSRTILRVATEIVRYQDSFFVSGIKGLNPLKLKIIADAVGMHESTVSRATANKYIATPRGIFEMKFFFTSGLSSLDDDTVYSSELIRQKIKQFVANEGENVLSDDKIGTILRGEGVDIARRTVAKYRTAMSIPSFFERRKKLSSHGRL